MLVSTLLARKGSSVATVPGEVPVEEMIAELARRQVGALVVSPEGRHIEGIVSERDVVRRLATDGAALLGRPVRTLMSPSVYTCRPEDDTEALMALMTDQRIRHVPVVDGEGLLVGLVSIGDVVKDTIDALQRDRAQLVSYIQAR